MRRVQSVSFYLGFILTCGGLSAADFDAGKRAFEEKDYAVAYKELTPFAAEGNAEAQVILGKMYMMGQGVLKDQDQALKLFKASAAQGDADAEFLLGATYLLPRQDVPEGLKWLRLSADQGNKDAQLLLGKTYLEGLPELPRDSELAEMWLRLSAKDNLPFYQHELQIAERQMTPDQVAKGKALADAWTPKPGSKPDAKAPDGRK